MSRCDNLVSSRVRHLVSSRREFAMALLYSVDIKGDPKDLLKKYDQAGRSFEAKAAALGKKAGGSPVVVHICVETPDGIRIMDLLDSPEIEAELPAATPRRKLIEPGKYLEWLERHDVLNYEQRDAARAVGLCDCPFTETTHSVHDFAVVRN
jgi:hypothetical protein